MKTTPEQLAELKELAEAATPGPWRIGALMSYDGYTGKPFRNVWQGKDDKARIIARAILDQGDEQTDVDSDAMFIAAAREAIPALLADLEEAAATLSAQKTELCEQQKYILELESALAVTRKQLEEAGRLSVKNILLDVVPGDGNGLEVFAQSVADIEAKLTALSEKAEETDSLRAELAATRQQLAEAQAQVKDAFTDGFCARETYNDTTLNDCDEEYAKYTYNTSALQSAIDTAIEPYRRDAAQRAPVYQMQIAENTYMDVSMGCYEKLDESERRTLYTAPLSSDPDVSARRRPRAALSAKEST